MKKALRTLRRFIPDALFTALEPAYHFLLAWAGALRYGFPSRKLIVVGVTGTNGKTTTVTLLYKIAIGLGFKAGLVSTVENIVNGKAVPTEQTTPDPFTLNKLLREMADAGCTHVFMEVSSHAMDQDRVSGIRFAGGIFTNLTHDHLDYHKTFENYFAAKKKFFRALKADAFALSNTDSAYGNGMLDGIRARKATYGFTGGETFHGSIARLKLDGIDLAVNGVGITSKLLGKFNAYNLLAVWSASNLLGFDSGKVAAFLMEIDPPAGRFQHFMASNGTLVIVDYAHTPDALENVLETIRGSFAGSRVISIFGCGGDRDPLKRSAMGRIGARLSDVAILTSDNPRSEDPDAIIAQIRSGVSDEDAAKVTIVSDRREAIREGVRQALKGDILLIAGKGHEDYQEIKGVKHRFNDREESQKAFASGRE